MTVPQQLIDALNLVQADYEALATADTTLAAAEKGAADAKSKLSADLTALIKLEQQIYAGSAIGIVIQPGTPVPK